MKLRLLLIGLLTLMTGLTHANDLSEWKPLLSVTELHELLEEDPFATTVVDIRALDSKDPEASYNAGHIPVAVLPLMQLGVGSLTIQASLLLKTN